MKKTKRRRVKMAKEIDVIEDYFVWEDNFKRWRVPKWFITKYHDYLLKTKDNDGLEIYIFTGIYDDKNATKNWRKFHRDLDRIKKPQLENALDHMIDNYYDLEENYDTLKSKYKSLKNDKTKAANEYFDLMSRYERLWEEKRALMKEKNEKK